MMLTGKTLLQAGLRLTNSKKYIYPIIKNDHKHERCYCISSLPFTPRYSDRDLAIMKCNFDEEDDDEDKFINMFQFNHFIQRTMGRSLDSRELYCVCIIILFINNKQKLTKKVIVIVCCGAWVSLTMADNYLFCYISRVLLLGSGDALEAHLDSIQ